MGDNGMLPNALSGLLRRALADGEALPRDRYRADARQWHGCEEGATRVCLAGMTMANALADGLREDDETCPADYETRGDGAAGKLRAIDFARTGRIQAALCALDGDWSNCARAAGATGERVVCDEAMTDAARAVLAKWRENPPRFGEFHDWADFDRFASEAREMASDLESVGL